MTKLRVLILYNKLFHYRIPIFNILAEKYDLTVAYSMGQDPVNEQIDFKTIRIPYRKVGRFTFQKGNMYDLCCNYDVVLLYGEIAWIKNTLLTINCSRPFAVVNWSIGVSASYDHAFDRNTFWNQVRYWITKHADALVFYTTYPINKYKQHGFEEEMLFVANNTVAVHPVADIATTKNCILFIGTLYMQKGIGTLLEAYLKAYKQNNNIPDLYLVGGGEELSKVEQWIKINFLDHKIKVTGPIYDINEKAKYFARAYATFSPSQAGLSVLESMGYGVPFVTTKNAITGGEIFNISNGENGLTLDDPSEIANVILDIAKTPSKYIKLGIAAKEHYDSCRKPEDMAMGLSQAIDYAFNKRKRRK